MKNIINLFIFFFILFSSFKTFAQPASKKPVPDNLIKYNDNSRKLKMQAKQVAQNKGDEIVRESKQRAPRHASDIIVDNSKERKTDKQISHYTGDVVLNDSKTRKTDKQIGNYSGDMVFDQSKTRKTDKVIGSYSGDIPVNYLQKRDHMRREKERKIASYEGDILVSTLEARARKIRKKSKEMANFEGDIIVKRVRKGMHPSAVYRGGNVKNSYAAKERYRKRMLKKYGKNDGIETPNYMKKKEAKPKYDKRESEIWR